MLEESYSNNISVPEQWADIVEEWEKENPINGWTSPEIFWPDYYTNKSNNKS